MRKTRIKFSQGPTKMTQANCRTPKVVLLNALRAAYMACPEILWTDDGGDYSDYVAEAWRALPLGEKREAIAAFAKAIAQGPNTGKHIRPQLAHCPIAWPEVPAMVFEAEEPELELEAA